MGINISASSLGLSSKMVAIPFEQKLHEHCPDALIAIYKSVAGRKTIPQTCDFLDLGGVPTIRRKRYGGGFKPCTIMQSVHSGGLDDSAVGQDNIVHFDPIHSAILV